MPLLPLFLVLPFLGHPSPVQTEHERIGRWVLTLKRDRFTGEQTCRLVSGAMSVERQALVLHLPRRTDTTAAVYRLDDGPVRHTIDDAPVLARQGFSLLDDDLDNPSGGLVRIPMGALADAREVRVQSRFGAPVITFRLNGLNSALAASRDAGCP